MPQVGIREFKVRASEILREVRFRRARYTVTYRGQPVGVLLPVSDVPPEPLDDQMAWDSLERLGAEIAKGWPPGLSSGEVVSEIRR